MSVLPPCTACHTAMVPSYERPTPPGMRRHHGSGICAVCHRDHTRPTRLRAWWAAVVKAVRG